MRERCLMQAGGSFSLRRLCDGHTTETKELVWDPLMKEPITVQANSFSQSTVSFHSLRDLDEAGRQLARLLWPMTTNFPTFDCFYIDTLGSAFAMQITINKNHGAIEYFDEMLGDSKPDTSTAPCLSCRKIWLRATKHKNLLVLSAAKRANQLPVLMLAQGLSNV
jgi:hypothetical protein